MSSPTFRLWRRITFWTLATLIAAGTRLIAAEPPKIERLFPAGGQRGTTVEAKVTGKSGEAVPQVWSQRQQLSLVCSDKKDSVAVIIPDDATPGVHWLRFYNAHGATDLRPFVVGLIQEASEVEPNNQVADAQVVDASAVTINGVLEKSADVDIYSFELKSGRTFVVSVDANRSLGSPMDAVLQLLDSGGNVIAQNDDDHGFDPQIAFPVATEGTYHVRIFAFPATPNSTIKLSAAASYVYRLTATTEAFADYSVPAMLTSTGDHTVSLRGWNLPNGAKAVGKLCGDGSHVVVDAGTSLPLKIAAVDHPSVGEISGQVQTLRIPSSLTGTLSAPEERDVYRFTAREKQKLAVAVAARALESQLDPIVTVASADGKVVKESDDRSREDLDSEASFTVPADGDYTVTIADRYGFGGERFFYVVSIQETQPEFTASVQQGHFVVPADKPLEIPVAVERRNGFAKKIAFTVQGLPDSVTAEPVISENEGDSKQSVTLKLIQKSPGLYATAVVRIVGKAQDENEPVFASYAIGDSRESMSDVFLTIPERLNQNDGDQKAAFEKE